MPDQSGSSDARKPAARQARAERLGRALRENLKRRKAQSRARAGAGGPAAPQKTPGGREGT